MTMQADNFPGRDADFSHLRFIIAGDDAAAPESRIPSKSNFPTLLAGLLVSLIFHFFLVLWQPVASSPKPVTTRINISLSKAAPTQPVAPAEKIPTTNNEVPADQSVKARPTDAISSQPPMQLPKESIESVTKNSPEDVPRPVISLTAEDIRELQTFHNSPNAKQTRGSISENVFNPALRKRLQEEEARPALQRADAGPKTHMDPSGATIVDLGNGKCLRSSALKPGEVQNWYMTACGGKSESDRIMERVDQSVNGRLYFE